ncbi:hypothetical protein [Pontixanthobacter luteolus]|uniref:hypothetical protein n=1 Tax=Pontixanthobacter luteolus TaxID=295089 RepID=UPI002303BC56|nr:hypothetical protein [Pontixanthobacter luteolus]
MRRRLIPLAMVALLAACDRGGEPTEPVTTIEPDQAIPVEPDGGIGDGAPPLDELAGNIPARFQGVWDYVGGTCNPASDMRTEIKPRQILYYESLGLVAGVGSEGSDALVDLVMEGEGEQWVQVSRLSLSADGKTLSVSDGTKPKVKDEYPRKRCPA